MRIALLTPGIARRLLVCRVSSLLLRETDRSLDRLRASVDFGLEWPARNRSPLTFPSREGLGCEMEDMMGNPLKISGVAVRAGVMAEPIRFYEAAGALPRPQRLLPRSR